MTDALEQPQENPKEWKAVYIGCNDWDLDGPRTKEEWELAALAPQLQEELNILRATLAQHDAVVYVPVDSRLRDKNGNHPKDTEPCDQACRKALDARGDGDGQGLCGYWKWGFKAGWNAAQRAVSYATPPTIPAERVPLTYEQIEKLLRSWPRDRITPFELVRAIEVSHGIDRE